MRENDSGITTILNNFVTPILLGSVGTITVLTMIQTYRHKSALHRRMNRIENQQRHQGTVLGHLNQWKDQTKKRLRDMTEEIEIAKGPGIEVREIVDSPRRENVA